MALTCFIDQTIGNCLPLPGRMELTHWSTVGDLGNSSVIGKLYWKLCGRDDLGPITCGLGNTNNHGGPCAPDGTANTLHPSSRSRLTLATIAHEVGITLPHITRGETVACPSHPAGEVELRLKFRLSISKVKGLNTLHHVPERGKEGL